jgi:hypothetical protein
MKVKLSLAIRLGCDNDGNITTIFAYLSLFFANDLVLFAFVVEREAINVAD